MSCTCSSARHARRLYRNHSSRYARFPSSAVTRFYTPACVGGKVERRFRKPRPDRTSLSARRRTRPFLQTQRRGNYIGASLTLDVNTISAKRVRSSRAPRVRRRVRRAHAEWHGFPRVRVFCRPMASAAVREASRAREGSHRDDRRLVARVPASCSPARAPRRDRTALRRPPAGWFFSTLVGVLLPDEGGHLRSDPFRSRSRSILGTRADTTSHSIPHLNSSRCRLSSPRRRRTSR